MAENKTASTRYLISKVEEFVGDATHWEVMDTAYPNGIGREVRTICQFKTKPEAEKFVAEQRVRDEQHGTR